jgi:glucose uptake protein GlcU
VQLGGNAIVMAQRNATSLVVSGLWGVLWYREIRGTALLAWGLMALLTVVCVVGLGFEKPPTAHPH